MPPPDRRCSPPQSSWTLLQTLHGHSRYVTCCCFSGDGRLLLSGSNDKTVRVWPLADGGSPGGSDGEPSAPPPAQPVKVRLAVCTSLV